MLLWVISVVHTEYGRVGFRMPIMTDGMERLKLLHKHQRHYGMEPRPDSQLTAMFVEGRTDLTVGEVARELMSTDFIYKHTLYGEIIEEYLRCLADTLKVYFPLITYHSLWKIVKFYGPISLKLIMIMRCGTRIPNKIVHKNEN